MAGLLDYDPQAAKQQALYSGLLGMGAQLLANSGRRYSTTPGGAPGLGAALGQGLLGFQQGADSSMRDSMQGALFGMKMDQAQQEKTRQKAYEDMLFKMANPANPGQNAMGIDGAMGNTARPAFNGTPSMANAMAQPPAAPTGAIPPEMLALLQGMPADKGSAALISMQQEALKQARTPPQRSTLERDGVKVTQEWDPVRRVYTDVATSKPDWQNPDYVNTQSQIRAAGRSQTNVNMPPMNKAEDEAYGKQLVSNFTTIQERGAAAQDALNQLGIARSIARDSQLPGELQLAVGNTAVALGIPLPEGIKTRVTDGQAFVSTMNNLILTKMQAQKGPQTENDAKRIEMTTARLGNTPEARDFLLRASTSLANRDVEQARFYENWRKQKGTLDGASTAWREEISQRPMLGTNPNSNLPVFYDEFVEGMKKANPGASQQQIMQVWKQKYGG